MMLHYYLSILPLCAKPSHTIILELLDLFDLARENRNTPLKNIIAYTHEENIKKIMDFYFRAYP